MRIPYRVQEICNFYPLSSKHGNALNHIGERIMSLLKALFTPIMPPKNYSFEQRNFETEYEEMKRQYLNKQRPNGTAAATLEADSQVPLSWRLR